MNPKDAWRESFSTNAADLLAIIRWAEGLTDEEFKHLLLAVFKWNLKRGGRGRKINETTVQNVLQARRAAWLESQAGN